MCNKVLFFLISVTFTHLLFEKTPVKLEDPSTDHINNNQKTSHPKVLWWLIGYGDLRITYFVRLRTIFTSSSNESKFNHYWTRSLVVPVDHREGLVRVMLRRPYGPQEYLPMRSLLQFSQKNVSVELFNSHFKKPVGDPFPFRRGHKSYSKRGYPVSRRWLILDKGFLPNPVSNSS